MLNLSITQWVRFYFWFRTAVQWQNPQWPCQKEQPSALPAPVSAITRVFPIFFARSTCPAHYWFYGRPYDSGPPWMPNLPFVILLSSWQKVPDTESNINSAPGRISSWCHPISPHRKYLPPKGTPYHLPPPMALCDFIPNVLSLIIDVSLCT